MKIKTVKNPQHSNCLGNKEYFVKLYGGDYCSIINGAVLWIDKRDIQATK